MAETYHVRPSDLLGVRHPARAYVIDRGIWHFVTAIQQDQDTAVGRLPKNAKESTKDHMRRHVLMTYLGVDPAESGMYRAPQATTKG